MKNFTLLILILTVIFSCKNKQSNNKNETDIDKLISQAQISLKDSLLTELKNIKECELNYDSLYSSFQLNKSYKNYLNRDKYSWFYSDLSDTTSFERTDDLKPLCLIYENRHIASIAFTDNYDYKQAIHIINFKKPEYTPKSSFILYSVGGDAEDFWYREVKKIANIKFRVTDKDGSINDIETQDTIYYNNIIVTDIEIDTVSGKLIKKVISKKSNFYELNK